MSVRTLLPVAGLAAGLALGLVHAPGYRATTTLLVKANGSPVALPTVAVLAKSDAVVANVANALGLKAGDVRKRLHAAVIAKTALVRIQADASSALRAQQIAQQEAVALEAIGSARLGKSVQIAVVDPATAKRRGKPILADAVWGLIVGLLLSLVRVSRTPKVSDPVTVSDTVAPASPPPPPPPPTPVRPSPLAELRAGLAVHRDEFSPDQVAEWEAYLDAFEAQVVDGALPPNVKGMADDVFEPLRARLGQPKS